MLPNNVITHFIYFWAQMEIDFFGNGTQMENNIRDFIWKNERKNANYCPSFSPGPI